MDSQLWIKVDDYFTGKLVGQEKSFSDALERQEKEGFPSINVPPTLGKLLYLLVKLIKARNVLEIGTLGGYSSLWLAKALPKGGKVTSLEIDRRHAEVSIENIRNAGLEEKVEILIGDAEDTLSNLSRKRVGTFDLVFIDADKERNPVYFKWAVNHSHPGSVIVVDNVVRDGKVVEGSDDDPSVRGTRQLVELVSKDQRVESTAIQTVSGKGDDGFMVVRIKD